MPKTLEQTKALQEKRMAALKKAALSLFALNGFSGVSVDDICKASDSSHGLFYHYYSSLEELFLVLLNEAEQNALPPFAELNVLSGWEGISKLIAYYDSVLTKGKSPETCYALLSLNTERQDKLNAKIKKKIATEKYLLKYIKEGQSEGRVIGGDPKEIMEAVSILIADSLKAKLKKKTLLSSFDILLGMLNKAPVH